jgi:hypothetical protein
MSLWQDLKDAHVRRFESYADSQGRYGRDEITLPEHMLKGAQTSVGMLSDIPGTVVTSALSAITPDVIKQGFQDVLSGVMDTEAAQAAIKLAQENPRAARNLGALGELAVEFLGAAGVKGGLKGAADNFAMNAQNNLPGFYGSGQLGPFVAGAKAGPRSTMHAINSSLNPVAAARQEAGVPSMLYATAKKAPKGKEEARQFGGQAAQSSMWDAGAGRSSGVRKEIFEDAHTIHTANRIEGKTFSDAMKAYRPDDFENLNTEGLADGFAAEFGRMKDRGTPWLKEGQEVAVRVRHPTTHGNLVRESQGASNASLSAKRLYAARTKWKGTDKTSFGSEQELREFVAERFLGKETWKRTDGKPFTTVDRKRLSLTGPGETYVRGEGNIDAVRDYAKMQQKLAAGKRLTKSQQARWDDYRATIEREAPQVRVDAQGRAWFNSSHKSAAMEMGGTGEAFALDMDGNMFHSMLDEHDIFRMRPPGDKRGFTMTPPTTYNIFEYGNKPADAAGAAARKAHRQKLTDKYAAEDMGGTPEGMLAQEAQALVNAMEDVKVAPRHYKNIGLMGLFAGKGVVEED